MTAVLLSLSFSALGQDKLVIAHRGASGYLPEHTLESKALAVAMGADFLEQDVLMTRDDALVVFHDLTLERMTDVESVFPGRARTDGSWYVIDFTLAELQTLRLHEGTHSTREGERAEYPGRFPPHLGHFRIHTLQEELEFIAGLRLSTGHAIGIYLELKSPWFHHQHDKDLSRAALLLLKHYDYHEANVEAPIYVQSFDYPELLRIRRQLFPELTMNVPLVQLIADNAWGETQTRGENGEWRNYDFSWMHSSEGMRDLARTVVGVGPAWTMLLPGVSSQEVLAGKAWVGRAHNAGLKVHPYTFRKEPDQWPVGVTSFESMLDLFFNTLNVDGVFTDYPDLARDFLQR